MRGCVGALPAVAITRLNSGGLGRSQLESRNGEFLDGVSGTGPAGLTKLLLTAARIRGRAPWPVVEIPDRDVRAMGDTSLPEGG